MVENVIPQICKTIIYSMLHNTYFENEILTLLKFLVEDKLSQLVIVNRILGNSKITENKRVK